jgi:hypothetical protein
MDDDSQTRGVNDAPHTTALYAAGNQSEIVSTAIAKMRVVDAADGSRRRGPMDLVS